MRTLSRAYTRAFEFRDATRDLYQQRLALDWPLWKIPDAEPCHLSRDFPELEMPEIDLQHASLADMVAGCDIDHSIGPVVDTQGGTAAGYARWQQFRQRQLSRYASLRNNPLVDGVSRLSAYLHYGMISPMRIAREAAQQDTAGSEKFLDELLIWRELAYAFCFYRPDHERWSALPDWARQSLQAHRKDKRPALYTWEQLARGQTHDELWNSAQQSLLKHGELHNNLRMTWGKAILNWQATPQQALRTILDLNHRYALDGRDPASYGGILWCLGQFDRPFEPEQAVLGKVRPRPTTSHAQRLDTVAYASKIARPRCALVPRVAVVGAGMSGLIAARTLCDSGMKVTVFEKSGGVGGRMATRRLNPQVAFDHGAQYFTVRDARFRRYVDSWIEQGLVACWPADSHAQAGVVVLKDGVLLADSNSVDRFVGVPGMNSVSQHLAKDLDLRLHTRAGRVQVRQGELTLFAEQGQSLGSFEQLVLAIPTPQALPIIEQSPELVAAIANINMHPCWAVMATFEKPLTAAWVGAFLHDSCLSWAARNHTKPGRNPAQEHLVLHAHSSWSHENLDRDPQQVVQDLLREFWRVSGLEPRLPLNSEAKRWKYAIPQTAHNHGCYSNAARNIHLCGDWAAGSRIEGAFLSGMAAAGRVLGTLQPIQHDHCLQLELF